MIDYSFWKVGAEEMSFCLKSDKILYNEMKVIFSA